MCLQGVCLTGPVVKGVGGEGVSRTKALVRLDGILRGVTVEKGSPYRCRFRDSLIS